MLVCPKYIVEDHKWFIETIEKEQSAQKAKTYTGNTELSRVRRTDFPLKKKPLVKIEHSLLACIFEIPESSTREISVRMAISDQVPGHDCFYSRHDVKLNLSCQA